MTNRRNPIEGLVGHHRHYNPAPDGNAEHLEGITSGSTVRSVSSSSRRRHPPRTTAAADDPPQFASTQWLDTEKREPRKAKGSRNLRKASGIESSHRPTSPQPAPKAPVADKEKDTFGFLPKLGRILEGRESKALRRRTSSATSTDDYTSTRHRSRPPEDATPGRRSIRRKHSSVQRRAESLAHLPNSSLVSLLSGTQQSSVSSNESNSTITQKSYKNHISKHRHEKERKRVPERERQEKRLAMDTRPESVFQYMNEGLSSEHFLGKTEDDDEKSSEAEASAESSDEEDDGRSSGAEEPMVESPMTSPASARVSASVPTGLGGIQGPDDAAAQSRGRFGSDSGISVRESSPESVHVAPGDHHVNYAEYEEEDEVSEEDEEPEEDEEEEDEEEQVEDEENRNEGHDERGSSSSEDDQDADQHPMQHPMQHLALDRVPPPRLPSTSSSRHSDSHTRRLRNQEQELRNHVLHPRPSQDLHFDGDHSPDAHPTMPLYDTHRHSVASPIDYHAPAPQRPIWPPPAPPVVGFYSPTYAPPAPYIQGPENNYAMAAPNNPTLANSALQQQQYYGPQHPTHQTHLAHPSNFPTQPTGPDLTHKTAAGYELLADKLTEAPKLDADADAPEAETETVVPMYRKFEQLNHRVLLHLQDEISELEEELRHTDECIAQYAPRATETGRILPASRRGEARYGSEMHYRRTELLGRIFLKLGQYNQALSSFSKMLNTMDPADTTDIKAYRTWLEKHKPIDAAETRFLEHGNDLLLVSRRRSVNGVGAANSANSVGGPNSVGSANGVGVGGVGLHQRAAIGLPIMAVLPLVAFALVPTLLGRLFVLVLVGGAAVVGVTSSEVVGLMSDRDWVVCGSVYFGLMALLAGVVH